MKLQEQVRLLFVVKVTQLDSSHSPDLSQSFEFLWKPLMRRSFKEDRQSSTFVWCSLIFYILFTSLLGKKVSLISW